MLFGLLLFKLRIKTDSHTNSQPVIHLEWAFISRYTLIKFFALTMWRNAA
jgi:hypothetical protein